MLLDGYTAKARGSDDYVSEWGSKPSLGRLATVYNQAGKARVVAMTNYFIQCGLYPIHRYLFTLLSQIRQDGTFDQYRPLKSLVDTHMSTNQVFYSFDLSAATDRLPIDFQVQVLNAVGLPGHA
jgi:hypothetical protein